MQSDTPQYGAGTVMLVWAAAAVPMGCLGWVVAPALARGTGDDVFVRLAVLTAGLAWQCALVALMIYREAHSLRWSVLRARLWLAGPRSPRTGTTDTRLWWWLVPVILLTALFDLRLKPIIDHVWVWMLPSLADRHEWSFGSAMATPEARAQLVGAWGTLGIYVTNAVFNTILGEELLFRGLLLPRMAGLFPRSDWLVNGILFGLYHVHQPWGILSSITHGVLFFALPSRIFRCTWFGIIAHSGQSLYFTFLIVGVVLGLA